MKELEHIEVPEVSIQQNIPKGITFLGSQQKVKGLTMFEFDPLAMTLEVAKYKEIKTQINKKYSAYEPEAKYTTVYKLEPKEGCVYVQALNKKNAYKKIAKLIHKR